MIHLDNIRPLTDFKRNTTEFREQLKRTGLPTVLTVEGRPELVVQDAAAYQKMLDVLERVETLQGIRAGLDSMKHGKGKASDEFFADLRAKLGLNEKRRK
ncbi:MAG: type II toxin-antitoxin system Phd/YefM family antitoxin [Pyrinomonadaceae bacterium]|nr:type II toxin-antitoxin system Phd/YefM family antitoxin [Phycisphaerales bacterium]